MEKIQFLINSKNCIFNLEKVVPEYDKVGH